MRIVQLRRMTWSWRSRRHLSNGQKKARDRRAFYERHASGFSGVPDQQHLCVNSHVFDPGLLVFVLLIIRY